MIIHVTFIQVKPTCGSQISMKGRQIIAETLILPYIWVLYGYTWIYMYVCTYRVYRRSVQYSVHIVSDSQAVHMLAPRADLQHCDRHCYHRYSALIA